MITTEMTAPEILKEVKKDMPHVLHALIKSYGGKRQFEADKKEMSDQVLRQPEGSIVLGNVESCTCGKTGNRWIIYSYAKNSGFHTATTGHREFVWMDTPDGSISAIMFSEPSRVFAWSPLVFSGHFFQRYAERENLGPVDLQLVTDFMRQNNDGVLQADAEPAEPGKYRFDVILRNGIGRGYTRGFDPSKPKQMFISNVCTYLPTSMLTPKQRQQTAEARAMQAGKSRPADTFVSRVMNQDTQGLLDSFSDMFTARGLPPHVGRAFANLMSSITLHEADITAPHNGECTPSDLRAILLKLYHRYEQNVFEYVVTHPSKSENYSMLETLVVAKATNHDLDIHAMLTSMMEPSPGDQRLLDFIDRASAKMEASFQEGIELGKIKP